MAALLRLQLYAELFHRPTGHSAVFQWNDQEQPEMTRLFCGKHSETEGEECQCQCHVNSLLLVSRYLSKIHHENDSTDGTPLISLQWSTHIVLDTSTVMDSVTLEYFRLILLVAHDTFENLSTSQANYPTLTSLLSRIRNPTTSNTRSVNYTAAYRELRSLLESHGLLEEQEQQKQVLPNIAISEPSHSELYDGPVECPGHPARCRCCVCCRRRERRHREHVRRHNCRHPKPFNWRLYYDYDNFELERNPERDQDEWRLLHMADVRHWHRQDEIRRSQPLIRDHALGLALAVGEGREMHRRRVREERIRAEKEAALRRMRSLAKVALPNQYVVSVQPRIRSHRQMRQFKRSRARHLAFMS